MDERTSGTEGEREAGRGERSSASAEGDAPDERTRRERLTDAFNAFRDTLEEAISGARDRGDTAEDRARELLRTATERARSATAEARDRFDFVTHDQFDELSRRVARLEAAMAERLGDSDAGDGEESPPD